MIMIIGPNGVGKTKIAFELARRHGGEVINLDRTYLYRHFPITTGLQDTLKEQNVTRHFYEILEPEENSILPNEFVEMVYAKSVEIRRNRKIAIAEGGSMLYVPSLLERNSFRKIFEHAIGLRISKGSEIEKRYSLRIEQALSDGLMEEIAASLPKYQNSFLIKECHSAVPIVSYLRGKMCLLDAKKEILKRCLDYKDRQLNLFSRYADVKWIEATSFEETYFNVQKTLGLATG